MGEFWEFIINIFNTEAFPPRWHCGRWSEFHGWLYIASDVAIWAAYFTIPLMLISFIRRKKNVPFPRLFWLFGAFILACGTTHLIDAIIFWFPIYRVSAVVRLLTAVVSWGTVLALYRVVPKALQLRTPRELEEQVNLRTHELNQTITKMRFMADAMPQIVWTAKPNGMLDYYNQQMVEYSGKSIDYLLGTGWEELLHPDDQNTTLEIWGNAVRFGTAFEIENRLLAANGNYYWHLTRGVPQYAEDGTVECWVGTATNIELQKRAAETLEKTVYERTEELRQANDMLLKSNKDLESFAGFASHDLQAPLRSISNYLSILEDRNRTILDDSFKSYINKAVDLCKRMRSLIETLLEFSRTNSTRAEMNPIRLQRLVENVTHTIYDEYPQKATIFNETRHTILGDETMLTQVLHNLIVNGIKYNPNENAIITISSTESSSHTFISVRDNGSGIAQEYLEKIFDAFTRLDSSVSGSGLGLSITRRIVEKHGGSISVASEVGVGTTFTIAIPKQ